MKNIIIKMKRPKVYGPMSRIYDPLINLNADVVRCQFADTSTGCHPKTFRMGREMCEFMMRYGHAAVRLIS